MLFADVGEGMTLPLLSEEVLDLLLCTAKGILGVCGVASTGGGRLPTSSGRAACAGSTTLFTASLKKLNGGGGLDRCSGLFVKAAAGELRAGGEKLATVPLLVPLPSRAIVDEDIKEVSPLVANGTSTSLRVVGGLGVLGTLTSGMADSSGVDGRSAGVTAASTAPSVLDLRRLKLSNSEASVGAMDRCSIRIFLEFKLKIR